MPETQRKHIRKNLLLKIEVTQILRRNESLKDFLLKYKFQGVDISATGMGVATGAPLNLDDRLFIRFTLPGENRALHVEGRVRNISEPTKAGEPKKVGLSFDKLSPLDAAHLANYIGSTHVLY